MSDVVRNLDQMKRLGYVLFGGGYSADQRPKAIIEAAMEIRRRGNADDFTNYSISFDGGAFRVMRVTRQGNLANELRWAMELAGITELPEFTEYHD